MPFSRRKDFSLDRSNLPITLFIQVVLCSEFLKLNLNQPKLHEEAFHLFRTDVMYIITGLFSNQPAVIC